MLSAATWTPDVGAPVSADVLFDTPGADVLDDLSTTEPSFRFRVSDLPGMIATPGGRVSARSQQYRVRRVHPIDDGLMARAWLTLLPPTL